MPKFFVNELGTIREAAKLFVNDSGTVRELTKLWALDNGTPRLVFEVVQGLPPISGTPIGGLSNAQQMCVSDFNIPVGGILLIPTDFWCWSDDTSMPGLCVDVNDVTVINRGNIIGRGGNGGGGNGGHALEITATGVTVTNAGFIAGGGGGGSGVTTNLGRAQSAGGGGGAGGGIGSRGSGNANSSFIAGGAIGQTGGGGAEAGASGGTGNDSAGSGGGRILPGVAHGLTGGAGGVAGGDVNGLTAGGGGGWGAPGGGGGLNDPGDGGDAVISSRIWNGLSGAGTAFGLVAPTIGSAQSINDFHHHLQVTLSSLGVSAGDTFTIPENFFFWSDDTTIPALTIDVNNVTIINNGIIMGRGGNGGGAFRAGSPGGCALNVTATGVSFTNNATGLVLGGGGGGGSGGFGSRNQAGGGGGGAGGGRGGTGTSRPRGSNDNLPGGTLGMNGGQANNGPGSPFGGTGGGLVSDGLGGGRVVVNPDTTPGTTVVGTAAGMGGGYGAAGATGTGGAGRAGAAGGSAICGNSVIVTNNGIIAGDSTGVQQGTFLSQTFSSSGTVSLTGTGPGWVFLTGGGGSGGAFIRVGSLPQAGPGGRGGTAGVFVPDLSVINGASFTIGAGGLSRVITSSGNNSDPGRAGASSSFSGGGVALSATGGGGGGELNFAAGATGVGSPAGTASLTDAQDYWAGFLVDDGNGNMVAGNTLVAAGGGNGGAASNVLNTNPGGQVFTARSGAGGAGRLTIIYQDQS